MSTVLAETDVPVDVKPVTDGSPVLFLRSGYNYDRDAVSVATGLFCSEDEDMAQQQFKEETDINVIVARFGLTGAMPENFAMPVSGDFTQAIDFQSAMNLIRKSNQEFLSLPAQLRDRFANDPQRLMDFLDRPENRDEAVKLGLVNAPVEKARDGSGLPTSVVVSPPA